MATEWEWKYEAKTMEENYEKLKKSAEASMNSFISLQEYWKLGK